MIAAVQIVARQLTPRGWAVIAILAAFLLFGAYCAHRGAQGVRDSHAAAEAKAAAKASAAREIAAIERAADNQTIRDRQEERDHAAQALPDSHPDEREFRRRCRQLREAGRILPACAGLDGPA